MSSVPESHCCMWFEHKTKRCENGDQCTWYHDSKNPTRYAVVQERRNRNAGHNLPVAVRNFVDGFLKDRTVTLRAGLEAVLECSKVVHGSDSFTNKEDWLDLATRLPRTLKRKRSEIEASTPLLSRNMDPPKKAGDCKSDVASDDIFMFERVKRLNRGILMWRNRTLQEGEQVVMDL